jgi:predicted nucleic acid-binding protein
MRVVLDTNVIISATRISAAGMNTGSSALGSEVRSS